MQGGEKLPLDMFLKVVDLVLEQPAPPEGVSGTRRVRVGPNTARCPKCDGIDFVPRAPDAPITNVSILVCYHCGQETPRGNLVVVAADDGAKLIAASLNRLRKHGEQQKETGTEAGPAAGDDEPGTPKRD
jgi:hypothetical protein